MAFAVQFEGCNFHKYSSCYVVICLCCIPNPILSPFLLPPPFPLPPPPPSPLFLSLTLPLPLSPSLLPSPPLPNPLPTFLFQLPDISTQTNDVSSALEGVDLQQQIQEGMQTFDDTTQNIQNQVNTSLDSSTGKGDSPLM